MPRRTPTGAARMWWCALLPLLLIGCRNEDNLCPAPTLIADPPEIPSGTNQTTLTVQVAGFEGFETVTTITAQSGAIGDRNASETTYGCAYDVTGPVQLCVEATYEPKATAESDVADVAGAMEYLRRPHVELPDPLVCSEKRCIEVVCPEVKNVCPVISSLTADPEALSTGQTATIEVVAQDPDGNSETLTTLLSARHGTIAAPTASRTTYSCDPNIGGVIEICVTASDGDPSCGEVERCTSVTCPGEQLDNTCPIIQSVSADPLAIPVGETTSQVAVVATDPDDSPVPLRVEWSSDTGVFEDRFASETTFTCGDSGPVQLCVKANDGDPDCDETSCLTVQCPSDIPANLCPQLFVINGIPRRIPVGETTTRVETRGQDTDGLPLPLALTLNALWGSFENTENIQQPFNVVQQDAIYICDRPGPVELCVDATDGACTKTLCDNVICPDDIPPP